MSLKEITMPQLGESVTEGTISKWLISPGDQVNKYDSIAEVMTDKVTAEVPILFTGIVKELVAMEGDTLAVGDVICTIEVTKTITNEESKNDQLKSNENNKSVVVKEETSSKRTRYSPAVLKLSQQHGIDLNEVTGTGAGGRITRKDILKIVELGTNKQTVEAMEDESDLKTSQTSENIEIKTTPQIEYETKLNDIEMPVTNLRKTIANNMVRSKREIPHAWMMVEVDVTKLVSFRNKIKDNFNNSEGFRITFFPFFIKAVSQALKDFPKMNAMWAGDKIVQKRDINLSIAVATEDALFVPVLKNADEKSIKGIAKRLAELTVKVQNNNLSLDDVKDGTFTINNTGAFGSVQSMGIINYPQAAILQVETIVPKPVVINNMIAIRDIVNICLSIDHRVIDGLVAGRFLQRVKEILENMSEDTISIY